MLRSGAYSLIALVSRSAKRSHSIPDGLNLLRAPKAIERDRVNWIVLLLDNDCCYVVGNDGSFAVVGALVGCVYL
ncbi:MAG: hypothetical protein IKY67_02820 [Paludibacteraceae bacterium]|nr:hypothetical protein [Paludibacteraceae bacterium]